jgi:hypothetical protein
VVFVIITSLTLDGGTNMLTSVCLSRLNALAELFRVFHVRESIRLLLLRGFSEDEIQGLRGIPPEE